MLVAASRGAVFPCPCLAFPMPSGAVAVQPIAARELAVFFGIRLSVEVARDNRRLGSLVPRRDEARHLLSLTFPHGIVCPAGGGRTVWRCEGCRQAGILEAAGDRGQVAVRGQMCGEDVEGTQGMGDARVEHMTEEERSEGTVEQHNLAGEHGIAGQDNFLVDASSEGGKPTA